MTTLKVPRSYVLIANKNTPNFPEHAVECSSWDAAQRHLKRMNESGLTDWLFAKVIPAVEYKQIIKSHPIVLENTFPNRFDD